MAVLAESTHMQRLCNIAIQPSSSDSDMAGLAKPANLISKHPLRYGRASETNEKEYQVWIAQSFNDSKHKRLNDAEDFDDVALAIANKCKSDW